ncbi:hypothetical protein HW130_04455 [Streptomyces sp. PKU-EA00015]|uniref:hypothetical protein n=1 Tax=Streptomyces sp. PKU-EA00015 TaxID=2748326 RepID=UPI0015A3DD0C|nr:hypothetical protein [Streptomyces sp. PKU-EA00015]NWF25520.1 hypothetical protein [Streptomyces sp. PKU-EA00015]
MRIRMLAVVAATAAALLGTVVPAAAAAGPDSHSKTAQSELAARPFAAQAATANLTTAQTASLQAKVDRYVTRTGGKQVALNKIDLNGRGELLVTVPGERHPRDFASGDGSRIAADPCLEGSVYSGWFCAYSGETYQGDALRWYYCGKRSMPWGGYGSWINDQTPGTRATFYNSSGGVHYVTPAPFSYSRSYYWTPVWHIRNC